MVATVISRDNDVRRCVGGNPQQNISAHSEGVRLLPAQRRRTCCLEQEISSGTSACPDHERSRGLAPLQAESSPSTPARSNTGCTSRTIPAQRSVRDSRPYRQGTSGRPARPWFPCPADFPPSARSRSPSACPHAPLPRRRSPLPPPTAPRNPSPPPFLPHCTPS